MRKTARFLALLLITQISMTSAFSTSRASGGDKLPAGLEEVARNFIVARDGNTSFVGQAWPSLTHKEQVLVFSGFKKAQRLAEAQSLLAQANSNLDSPLYAGKISFTGTIKSLISIYETSLENRNLSSSEIYIALSDYKLRLTQMALQYKKEKPRVKNVNRRIIDLASLFSMAYIDSVESRSLNDLESAKIFAKLASQILTEAYIEVEANFNNQITEPQFIKDSLVLEALHVLATYPLTSKIFHSLETKANIKSFWTEVARFSGASSYAFVPLSTNSDSYKFALPENGLESRAMMQLVVDHLSQLSGTATPILHDYNLADYQRLAACGYLMAP